MSTARLGFLYASQVKCTAFGRLSLSEEEGERDGLSRPAVVRALQPLTSVLSPLLGERRQKDLAQTKSVASLASL
jgi:hypothetical protein